MLAWPAASSSLTAVETSAMERAIELAARGAGTALPNTVVGCVLLSAAGRVVGESFHERAGGPHAEVIALQEAGGAAAGATAVVTPEPCDRTGRTGPCSKALIDAGALLAAAAVRWTMRSNTPGGISSPSTTSSATSSATSSTPTACTSGRNHIPQSIQ